MLRFPIILAMAIASLLPMPCLAQGQASARACSAKLAQVQSGQSQDAAADVDWLSSYCDKGTRDAAINAVGEATMDAAIQDAQAASHAAADQAKSDTAEIRASAKAATGDAMGGIFQAGAAIVAAGPAPPTVVVVRPEPRPVPVR